MTWFDVFAERKCSVCKRPVKPSHGLMRAFWYNQPRAERNVQRSMSA